MHNNEFIPNPYQVLLDRLDRMERKIDELVGYKSNFKEEAPKIELMTVEDAKGYLKISASTLYQKTARKEIPFMKKGKRLYFKKEDLSQWIGYYGDADPLIPVILTPSMGHGSENTMS